MSENIKKLEPGDQYSPYEKIMLMCGHMSLVAYRVQQVIQQRRQTIYAIETGKLGEDTDASFHKGLLKDAEELLTEVSGTLYKEYEDLVNYCNGCDAVSESDIAIGAPVYNVMNDIVDTNAL